MKTKKKVLLSIVSWLLVLSLIGCSQNSSQLDNNSSDYETTISQESEGNASTDSQSQSGQADAGGNSISNENSSGNSVSLSDIPAYSGSPYVTINNNVPFFTDSDYTTTSYETYSELDSLGRCGPAIACVGKDLMPTQERGNIGDVKPTGWHTVKYAGIDGNYLYNRCHLIMYALTGENANTKNLITGTRYLNVEGMLPFEEKTHDYIESTGNHVLYRVTPIFDGNNLLASGVLMEAYSVEDNGSGIKFCIYCYNVQPGVTIDYSTGDSQGPEFTGSESNTDTKVNLNQAETNSSTPASGGGSGEVKNYILNTNTKKFHLPGCKSAAKIADKNRKEYSGSRQDLINQGYDPCKNCNP